MRNLLAVSLLTLFAVSAAADDVHLKDGRVLSGKVVEEKSRYLVVDRDQKHVAKRSDVAKVVTAESFMDRYEKKLADLLEDDAEAIYEFGRWLSENDWTSRAHRAYEAVLDLDPDHRGARRALGYQLYEGEWVSPRELNIRKGLVEFEGRWYTKHDHAELLSAIKRDKKLAAAYQQRRKVNAKLNKIVRKFQTFDKKRRAKAYTELYTYAEQMNSPKLRKFADDTKAYYDNLAHVLCQQMMARTELHLTKTTLKKPIQTFETNLGAAIAIIAAQNPVKIQLPELEIIEVHTTADIPAGCN
ncbi:MAG: hypothetical protein ACYTGN_02855 [Planctomycetota bacterium]|jgi:hypothetical protein